MDKKMTLFDFYISENTVLFCDSINVDVAMVTVSFCKYFTDRDSVIIQLIFQFIIVNFQADGFHYNH